MSVAPRNLKQPKGERPHRGPYTVEDYLALDDDMRYELLDGELVVSPAPIERHQLVVGQLYRILADHVEARDLGTVFIAPLDIVLSPMTVCQPDILFISNERASIRTRERVQGAPDLAVEVLSDSRQRYDRVVKLRLYEEAGVQHYWLVHPEENTLEERVRDAASGKLVERAALEVADGTFTPAVFPDMTIDLAKLFR